MNNSACQTAEEKNKVLPGVLYLVATPIGNLSDLSERAEKVLHEVDFVACEDTRNSMKLLTLLGISKPVVSYFEHNKAVKGKEIAARLKAGESCAFQRPHKRPDIFTAARRVRHQQRHARLGKAHKAASSRLYERPSGKAAQAHRDQIRHVISISALDVRSPPMYTS